MGENQQRILFGLVKIGRVSDEVMDAFAVLRHKPKVLRQTPVDLRDPRGIEVGNHLVIAGGRIVQHDLGGLGRCSVSRNQAVWSRHWIRVSLGDFFHGAALRRKGKYPVEAFVFGLDVDRLIRRREIGGDRSVPIRG